MEVVDAHVHLFRRFAGIMSGVPIVSADYGRVKVGNSLQQFLPPSFERSDSSLETFMAHMDWADISKAVLVPNVIYGYHNDYAAEACELYPDRFRAVALVDIVRAQRAASELERYVGSGFFCGLKIETQSAFECSPGLRLDDPSLDPVWEYCNDMKMIVMIHLCRSHDPPSLRALVNRYNGIKFVICHLGSPPCEGWAEILEMGHGHSVWMELSGLPGRWIGEDYPYPTAVWHIERAYQELGPGRLIWASDYPGILAQCTYRQTLDMVRKECKHIPDRDKDMVLGQNALELFWNG